MHDNRGDGTIPPEIEAVLLGVRALARGIDAYRSALGAAHGLATADVITLSHLLYEEPASAGDIAERTALAPGSVTALLDRLERRGYLSRERPADNRRTTSVRLTAPGRALAETIVRPVVPAVVRAAGEPDAPDAARLAHCLTRIAELLDELSRTAGQADPG